jgi:hypothetical protein
MAGFGDVTLSIDTRPAEQRLAGFDQKHVARVITTASNDTARQVAREAISRIARLSGIPRKVTKPAVTIRKASVNQPVSSVRIRNRAIGLVAFTTGRKPPKRRPKVGARAKVFRQRKTYPGAFFVEVAPGKYEIFKRDGKARTPIARMFGPTPASVARMPELHADLQMVAADRLETNLARQIDRRYRALTGTAPLTGHAARRLMR